MQAFVTESAKTGDADCNLIDLHCNKQLIMLLRKPQMLKKSGINNVCAEKQSTVRSRDAIGEKKRACTYCGQLKEYPPLPIPPLPTLLTHPPKISFHISS